ncbi:MAG: hypothetical protein ABIK65_10620 [Candidatus Eisenbacteria bacterium]
MRIRPAPVLALLLVPCAFARAERPPFDSGRLSFHVKFKNEMSPYRVLAVPVLPEENFGFEVVDSAGVREYVVRAEEGPLRKTGGRSWEWTAPARTGRYDLRIHPADSEEIMTLHLFVTVPTKKIADDSLNGYRIGDYFWAKPWDKAMYRPPPGLMEATAENETTHVSPHFTLGRFLCKQQGGYPKYLVLRPRFLRKLERILEATNAAGFRCDTFGILSGYRTPWYNKAIGNVKYSRHVWGGAADIYIDEDPKDGMMDDLNGDGRTDVDDAAVLYEIIDRLYRRPWWSPFVGGLGTYKRTYNHGPFVHVDTRGEHTRWAD